MRKKNIRYFTLVLALLSACFYSQAQDGISVSGKVIDDAAKIGLSSVSISLGKKVLDRTDLEGNFKLTVPAGSQLRFTSIGFESATYTVKTTDSAILIVMKVDNKSMESVVVEGFTQKSKKLQTTATSRISGDVVRLAPASSFVDLLQGRVPGLNIQNNNGSPGSIGTINMRGVSTIGVSSDGLVTPTSPLFVIDGVQVDANTNYEYGFQSGGTGINPLSLIPQDDIESIDFLRDAAAISQYGSRGAYGVIIVTTKRGRSKKPIVSFSTNLFYNTPPSLIRTIGGRAERDISINTVLNYDTARNESSKALVNGTPILSDSLNPYFNNSTNWQKYFYSSSFNQSHNLQISGGDNEFNYKTNINYYSEKGIIKNTDLRRYTLSMQTQYMPNIKFKMLGNISAALGDKGNGSGTGMIQTGVARSASASSLLPPPSLYSGNNIALDNDRSNNLNKTSNINASLDVTYEFIKGLQANNQVSYNYNVNSNNRVTPAFLSGNSSSVYTVDSRVYNFQDRVKLQYSYQFGKHTGFVYAFNEVSSYGQRTDAVKIIGTANDQIIGPVGSIYGASGGGSYGVKETRTHAYGGAFSYSFDSRYVLDLGIRRDITSTNGPARGYIQSPTISGKWNFGMEKFRPSWLSNGAIRASWAQVIRPVGTIFDVYGRYTVGGQYNNNPTVYINLGNIPNPDFSPEQRRDLNLGLDIGLFKNNLTFSVDVYEKVTSNQVVGQELNSSVNAFSNLSVNGGTVSNRGVEFEANAVILNKGDWKVNLNFNGAYDKSTLVELPGGIRELRKDVKDDQIYIPVMQRIGLSQFSNVMFINRGVYASTNDVPVNPATGERLKLGKTGRNYFKAGDPIWLDINGDYVIDENDQVPIGNPIPLITGGFNPVIRYKNFTFSSSLVFTLKRDIINQVLAAQLNAYTSPLGNSTSGASLQPIDDLNYWRPINGDLDNGTVGAIYPNPFDFRRAGTMQPYRFNQDLYIEDGSYFKINVVNLAYDINPNLIKRYGLSQLRLTASVYNVYTFTKYSGVNPETVTQLGRDISGGYPNPRRFAFGINVRF